MTPIENIRQKLGMKQAEFAVVAGATQATVSRWETRALFPNQEKLERIREYARTRIPHWNDRLLFEVPAEYASAHANSPRAFTSVKRMVNPRSVAAAGRSK
jgi:transcriptional regulator with XRE-family HTH domain